MSTQAEIEKLLASLPPDQRAKLKAYMEGNPTGAVEVPDANAMGTLHFVRRDGSTGTAHLDYKDVWMLLYAVEQVQEAGQFEAESYGQRYSSLANKVFEAYGAKPEPSGIKVVVKLNYSWKNPSSTHASCLVKFVGTGDKFQALKDANDAIRRETSNKAYAFIPRTVNGEEADNEYFDEWFWTTGACIAYLTRHPEATEMVLDGGME